MARAPASRTTRLHTRRFGQGRQSTPLAFNWYAVAAAKPPDVRSNHSWADRRNSSVILEANFRSISSRSHVVVSVMESPPYP
jgi:hypothetical protein